MKKFPLQILLLIVATASVFGQYQSQEVSDVDGVPVLIKHLPDWESVKGQAKITNSVDEIRREFGNPAVLNAIDLNGGAEAAYAAYGDSRLLLIEYPTPQASLSADAAIQSAIGGSAGVVYKRIGNYNAFVFGAADPAAAEALLGKIEYGKKVQWLGDDPFYLQKFERYVAQTGADVAVSTVFFILGIFATAILLGVGVGYVFFRIRENERAHRTAYSDAGGLTRLNLDELSE
ncbi:MAG: hypothetical protein ABIR33_07580 [Pyrinomonadaceae bacterium]